MSRVVPLAYRRASLTIEVSQTAGRGMSAPAGLGLFVEEQEPHRTSRGADPAPAGFGGRRPQRPKGAAGSVRGADPAQAGFGGRQGPSAQKALLVLAGEPKGQGETARFDWPFRGAPSPQRPKGAVGSGRGSRQLREERNVSSWAVGGGAQPPGNVAAKRATSLVCVRGSRARPKRSQAMRCHSQHSGEVARSAATLPPLLLCFCVKVACDRSAGPVDDSEGRMRPKGLATGLLLIFADDPE